MQSKAEGLKHVGSRSFKQEPSNDKKTQDDEIRRPIRACTYYWATILKF